MPHSLLTSVNKLRDEGFCISKTYGQYDLLEIPKKYR